MGKRTYSLVAGVALLCVAIFFFTVPELLDYDAFIPVILGLLSLMSGIAILLIGLGGEK